jgi:peptidoglycan/LPS O-acetylase OafA/YrhL
MTVLEIVGWGYCVYVMHSYPKSIYDAAVVFVMFGLLLIGINRYSYLSHLIQFGWTKHLASISTVIYLNHFYWGRLIEKELPELSRAKQTLIYFSLIAVSSAVVYALGKLAMFLWDRRKTLNKA